MLEYLQRLRIPHGWLVDWNTFPEFDPTEEKAGYFGGSSLFSATNHHRRFWIDVEWRPEFDVSGRYRLRVEYAPWERTERGRRRKDAPLHFRDAEVVHQYETRSRLELVHELESWLARCTTWVREGS